MAIEVPATIRKEPRHVEYIISPKPEFVKTSFGGSYVKVTSNCKLYVIENAFTSELVGKLIGNPKEVVALKPPEGYAINPRVGYFIHIANEELYKKILANCNVIYSVKVPIGYSGTFQYHMFVSPIGKEHAANETDEYMNRIKNEGVLLETIYKIADQKSPKISDEEINKYQKQGIEAAFRLVKKEFEKKHKLRKTLKEKLFNVLNDLLHA